MGGFNRHRAKAKYRQIVERDGSACWLCGLPVKKTPRGKMRPSIDHAIPKSEGGTADIANLRLAHYACNQARGNKVPDDHLADNPLKKTA
jgi:5-methylcytosine-specific restriction endonuclease McrA